MGPMGHTLSQPIYVHNLPDHALGIQDPLNPLPEYLLVYSQAVPVLPYQSVL